MDYNDFAAAEYKKLMSDSIEEKVKQRILECKKLDIHNIVRRLFNSYTLEGIKKIGILEFGIDKIDVVDIAVRNQSIEITKNGGLVYYFTEKREEVEKYSMWNGVDQTTISLSVNSNIVFRSKWRRSYNMSRMDYDSTDHPEEILSYIPGVWSDDLLEIISKKKKIEEEDYRIKAEQEKMRKLNEDKANFGL
jgi:hypothetical protein